MPTFLMDIHFVRFKVVELFAYRGLIFGGQPCPRLIGASVIFVARGYFDIVIKFDYLKMRKWCNVCEYDVPITKKFQQPRADELNTFV